MGKRVLVTGSAGLIGSALTYKLRQRGVEVVGQDMAAEALSERGDVRDSSALGHRIVGSSGVVHLAAVSRVIWAQKDPGACWSTNVHGTEAVLRAAQALRPQPWVLFGSSREVYGEPASLPANETTPLAPINTYGRSKVAGEALVEAAREGGLRASIVRLSNVYGRVSDHPDRVVPAFARAAACGSSLWVEGARRTFDFTHIDDAVRGIVSAMDLLEEGTAPPPIQLVTGVPTSLGELAATAVALAGTGAQIQARRERDYDVSRFYGSYDRARSLLGWEPSLSIREGLRRLIDDYRLLLNASAAEVVSG